MTKIFGLFLTIILFGNLAFGSPLVFKLKKSIITNDLIELGTFDATKYKQIRIAVNVVADGNKPTVTKSIAQIELNLVNRELKRKKELLESGDISRSEYDQVEARAKVAQQIYDNALEKIYPSVSFFGIEDNEAIPLTNFDERSYARSIVDERGYWVSVIIDSPPSKVSIRVSGKGSYL